MKKIYLLFLALCFTLGISAQSFPIDRSIPKGDWVFGAGVNAVNSLGSKNPFYKPGDWAFSNPFIISAERRWFNIFSIEISFSTNNFDVLAPIDAAGPTTEELEYYAIDSALKYYFGEYLFPRAKWVDLFASGGLGIFRIGDENISGNLGAGVLFWLNRDRTFGLKAQGIGKFAINHDDRGSIYPNNHYQYSLQVVYRLE